MKKSIDKTRAENRGKKNVMEILKINNFVKKKIEKTLKKKKDKYKVSIKSVIKLK